MTALLQAECVIVEFGGLKAVNCVSMSVGKGEIRGLIGPNGAGKTTLFNAISGIVPQTGGSILFKGEEISSLQPHDRATAGIRRTFQAVQLIQNATVMENVLIGMHRQIEQGWLDLLFGWDARRSADYRAQRRAYEVLDFLGIADRGLKPVGTLSFGEQRRVEIARALVASPDLLMLDEPAAGLSPSEVEGLEQLLRTLGKDHSLTVIIVEHVLSLVFNLCDRITVLESGGVIADDTPAAIAEDPQVRTAYLGSDDVHAH